MSRPLRQRLEQLLCRYEEMCDTLLDLRELLRRLLVEVTGGSALHAMQVWYHVRREYPHSDDDRPTIVQSRRRFAGRDRLGLDSRHCSLAEGGLMADSFPCRGPFVASTSVNFASAACLMAARVWSVECLRLRVEACEGCSGARGEIQAG